MKAKKYKILYIIALSLILCIFNNTSRATIIEYPLDCAGTYGFDDSWEKDFDLEEEFIDIERVSINWSGEFSACRGIYNRNPDDPFPLDVGILADLGRNPTSRTTKVTGGAIHYPNPETFDITSVFVLYGNETWSDLLDGKGHIKIYYVQPFIVDGKIIEQGSVILNNATLIFNGTLVPEPVTIIILASGSVLVLRRRKKDIHSI